MVSHCDKCILIILMLAVAFISGCAKSYKFELIRPSTADEDNISDTLSPAYPDEIYVVLKPSFDENINDSFLCPHEDVNAVNRAKTTAVLVIGHNADRDQDIEENAVLVLESANATWFGSSQVCNKSLRETELGDIVLMNMHKHINVEIILRQETSSDFDDLSEAISDLVSGDSASIFWDELLKKANEIYSSQKKSTPATGYEKLMIPGEELVLKITRDDNESAHRINILADIKLSKLDVDHECSERNEECLDYSKMTQAHFTDEVSDLVKKANRSMDNKNIDIINDRCIVLKNDLINAEYAEQDIAFVLSQYLSDFTLFKNSDIKNEISTYERNLSSISDQNERDEFLSRISNTEEKISTLQYNIERIKCISDYMNAIERYMIPFVDSDELHSSTDTINLIKRSLEGLEFITRAEAAERFMGEFFEFSRTHGSIAVDRLAPNISLNIHNIPDNNQVFNGPSSELASHLRWLNLERVGCVLDMLSISRASLHDPSPRQLRQTTYGDGDFTKNRHFLFVGEYNQNDQAKLAVIRGGFQDIIPSPQANSRWIVNHLEIAPLTPEEYTTINSEFDEDTDCKNSDILEIFSS